MNRSPDADTKTSAKEFVGWIESMQASTRPVKLEKLPKAMDLPPETIEEAIDATERQNAHGGPPSNLLPISRRGATGHRKDSMELLAA